MEEAAKQDPRWKERRVAQYNRDMQYFSGALFRLFTIMPFEVRVFQDGKFQQHIPEEWQVKIDRIIAERDRYVKENYSDLISI
jgi:hypothetical protein